MKAIAAFFITWFHFKWFVPSHFAPLFVGGAFGNSLFFFCSGYLLKFREEKYFGQWILAKYLRLMPVVWVTFTLCCVTHFYTDCRWEPTSFRQWILPEYYWFVCSILLYYLICWICRRFLFNKNCRKNTVIMIVVTCVIQVLWYFLLCDTTNVNIDEGYIKAWYFFAFFLWGYYCKLKQTDHNKQKWGILFAPLILGLFFVYKYISANNFYFAYWQVLFVPLLLCFVIMSFRELAYLLTSVRVPILLKQMIIFISNITLEIYIVQIHVLEFVMPRVLFPYNILVSIFFILLFAYLVHKSVDFMSKWLKVYCGF